MIFGFTDPVKNIKELNLKNDSFVADFGSGVGHYVFPLAEILKDGGKVYAVDIQKDLLSKIKNEASEKHLDNVEVIWADLESLGGSKIRSGSLDALIASNILFQVEDKKAFCAECARVLKSGGRLFFIDWSDSFGGIGPAPGHVIKEENAKKIFSEEGFSLQKEIPAGAHHYGMIFVKN
jgi:ubiquinone/menaquinone biosynthesis C-methylase UbiE